MARDADEARFCPHRPVSKMDSNGQAGVVVAAIGRADVFVPPGSVPALGLGAGTIRVAGVLDTAPPTLFADEQNSASRHSIDLSRISRNSLRTCEIER